MYHFLFLFSFFGGGGDEWIYFLAVLGIEIEREGERMMLTC